MGKRVSNVRYLEFRALQWWPGLLHSFQHNWRDSWTEALCFLLKMIILLLLFYTSPCLWVRRPGIKIKYTPTWLLPFTNIIPHDIAILITNFSFQHLHCSRTECPGFCSLCLIWKALRRNISSNPLGFSDIQMNRRWSRLRWWRKPLQTLEE